MNVSSTFAFALIPVDACACWTCCTYACTFFDLFFCDCQCWEGGGSAAHIFEAEGLVNDSLRGSLWLVLLLGGHRCAPAGSSEMEGRPLCCPWPL